MARSPTTTPGLVVLFTGLSGAGKSTLASALVDHLTAHDSRQVTLLDGDDVRLMLSKGLGFSHEDRALNLRRIGWVAALVARHSGIAVCSFIAPYTDSRAEIRAMAEKHARFVLVHVSTPLEVCEGRDPKGLYSRARLGELLQFTGISDPYETPLDADVTLDLSDMTTAAAVQAVLAHIPLVSRS